MERVLVAGATGALGRHVVAALKQKGCWVRILSRSPQRAASVGADDVFIADATEPARLADACSNITRVFSCLGQSVSSDLSNRGPGYEAVDYVANHNLLNAAKQATVERFVYVSVFGAEAFPRVAYLKAHADVAAEVRESGLSYAIVQPTGFFSAYRTFFDLARNGQGFVFGDGLARTNPIHDADLADICADAVLSDASAEIAAGGPAIYSRREVFEEAFAALGRTPRLRALPIWLPYLMGAVAKPFAPRIGELMAFFGAISSVDLVAPVRGTQRLDMYYRQLAAETL